MKIYLAIKSVSSPIANYEKGAQTHLIELYRQSLVSWPILLSSSLPSQLYVDFGRLFLCLVYSRELADLMKVKLLGGLWIEVPLDSALLQESYQYP